MMFADAIRQAKNEHEVYFLLTAYVESARYCDPLNLLPESMKRLPLGGTDDISEQYQQLIVELDKASKGLKNNACVVLKEALHVFSVALDRLQSLDAAQLHPIPERRKRERRQLENKVFREPQSGTQSERNHGYRRPARSRGD